MWTITLSDANGQFCIHTADQEVYTRLMDQVRASRFALINAEYVKG